MRRILTVAAVSAVSLFALGGVAQAQEPPAPDQTLPPTFVPPAPTPVTDVASAEAFAEGYATRNAARFLRERRNRVRVIDANAACLEHPAIANRYGCIFTLRALVAQRRHGWGKGHDAKASTRRGDRDHRRRFRIRSYGCLGALTVIGGPTPQGILRFVECARVPRGDLTAPEPTPVG